MKEILTLFVQVEQLMFSSSRRMLLGRGVIHAQKDSRLRAVLR